MVKKLTTYVQQCFINNKYNSILINMRIAGMLSSKSEVQEVQFIASVSTIRERIHYIIRKEKIKQLLKQEKTINKIDKELK